MDPERLPWVQKMIIAGTAEARKEALAKLLPMQYADFYAMFKELGDKPLTVRLLDPPLHEFLPNKEDLIAEVATLKALGKDASEKEEMLHIVEGLSESNPMMGLSRPWTPGRSRDPPSRCPRARPRRGCKPYRRRRHNRWTTASALRRNLPWGAP